MAGFIEQTKKGNLTIMKNGFLCSAGITEKVEKYLGDQYGNPLIISNKELPPHIAQGGSIRPKNFVYYEKIGAIIEGDIISKIGKELYFTDMATGELSYEQFS